MNLEIFQNSGFELRGGLINGEPFFVLADICKALNLTNPTEVAKTLNESTLSIIEVAINNRQVKVNAVKGWIIIVDWQQKENYSWYINEIYHSKVGNKILNTEIKESVYYWFENGELKYEI